MVRLATPLAAAALMLAAGCGGGGSHEQQPEVIATLRATATAPPTAEPTAPPVVFATPAPVASRAATPPPSETPAPTSTPAANRNPSFPQGPLQEVNTTYERDEDGAITGAVTTMVAPAATDPDGDALTYSWAVTTGTVTNDALTGKWVRAIAAGQEIPGKVTVTAADGRGGVGTFNVDFQ